jgi:hypothetical protein
MTDIPADESRPAAPVANRFRGKVALVTGAGCVGPGWGNGRATAVRLADEGATVIALDRNPEHLRETIARAGASAAAIHPMPCDVTDGAAIAALVQTCLARFGRIDVLVNNVGGSAAGGPVEMSEAVWDAQIDLNLKSVFLTCKHVLPVMERQAGGAVVNVRRLPDAPDWCAQVAYSATSRVIQLSRVWRAMRLRDPAQQRRTGPAARRDSNAPGGKWSGGDVEACSPAPPVPLGFMGDGRDTAAAVLYLASTMPDSSPALNASMAE